MTGTDAVAVSAQGEQSRSLRPRDAATLIVVRDQREILVGVRSAGHVFMPHLYVFPGGRVDAGDARVPSPVQLRAPELNKLTKTLSPARARALAMTAVRETYEETGLILGRPTKQPPSTSSPHWQPFFETGHVAALDRLRYVARAITPPNPLRRYDARFFLADAKHCSGQLRGNGELEDLRWVTLKQAARLELSPVTELVLELLGNKLLQGRSSSRVPLYWSRFGRERIDYE
ncbi:NUDIX hydrolase [Halieaceae bacterium IMCC14734]|uniref:NUDIX hydrolase n=1 Tax=Candidatus Litorirhabdus singularis TaxID=2518993 RepID=A0ABT3TIA9_9GAMM|nr:NUDIX hydrolase [Candidatus Litorirhabdus singularis]MCX2981107.1 NUDIX hydrolase [Candidatus Litorirhabdus singularis]